MMEQFGDIWVSGPTGVSIFQYTIGERTWANVLIGKLFGERAIADVEVIKTPVSRFYIENGKENFVHNDYKMVGVTTDDRIPVITEIIA